VINLIHGKRDGTRNWEFEIISNKKNGIDVVFSNSVLNWTRRYIGRGNEMKPFTDNDPEESYHLCTHRYHNGALEYQIFEGKLWKCPPLAYLNLVKNKYQLGKEWDHYLSYKPLEFTNDISKVYDFMNLASESYCSMCPAYNRPIKIDNPLRS
jgi:hypothetical protein